MALPREAAKDIGTVPGGSKRAQDNQTKKENTSNVNDTGTFSFLYPSNLGGCIKDIKSDKYKIYVTKLSNLNNYYYRTGYNYNSEATPTSGASQAANCYTSNKNFAAQVSASDRAKYGNEQYNWTRLKDGTVLANCVGWANGRLWEIWGRALSTGYIKWDSSQNSYVISDTGAKIKGSFNYPYWPSAYTAYQWWDFWPGGTVESGWYKSSTPQVGAVVCWGDGENGDQRPGHVAIVEKILNAGQKDESLVISHSAYTPNGTMYLVKIDEIYKSTNYKFYDCCKLRGFLISPVCQLASTNARKIIGESIVQEASEVDHAQIQLRTELLSGRTLPVDLPRNAQVKVTRIGYKKPSGGTIISDRINNIGLTGIIWTKDLSNPYPYGICKDDDPNHEIQGYYDRTGLDVISDGTMTSETIRINWDDEGHTNSRPSEIVVKISWSNVSIYGIALGAHRDIVLNPQNNWSAKVAALPKYSPNQRKNEFKWEIVSKLPTHYKEEKDLKVKLNGNTMLTIKYY